MLRSMHACGFFTRRRILKKSSIVPVLIFSTILFSNTFAHGQLSEIIDMYAFYAELIIEGTVLDVAVDSIQYITVAPRYTWMTNLTLRIDKLWAGYYQNETIVVSVPGGIIAGKGGRKVIGHARKFEISDRLLLFVRYDNVFGRHFTYNEGEFFLHDGNVLYAEERIEVPADDFWEKLESNSKNRRIGELTRQSDLTVRGTIEELHDGSFTFKIDEVIKGDEKNNLISVSIRRFEDQEGEIPWIFFGPRAYSVDTKYVLFLKQKDSVYYPFAGLNGVFEIHGEDITINGRIIKNGWLSIRDEIEGIKQ